VCLQQQPALALFTAFTYQESTMTSFVHTEFPTSHPGVERFELVFAAGQATAKKFDSGRGLATILLAATVSALLVVANQVIEAWSDGHLLLAWIALWAVAFAALALLAGPARQLARNVRPALAAWRAARKAQAEDRKLWELACQDARVMSDISAAMARQAA
jgi:hypothetical protein